MIISDRVSLLILVKYPREDYVKTRLATRVGMKAATLLYRDFVEICLQRYPQSRHVDCTIYFDPPEEEDAFRQWIGCGFPYLSQPDGDFGLRLRVGMETQLKRYSRVIAIGTDTPDLPLSYLEQACSSLSDNAVVLGPADDGGYYLIGLSASIPSLFENISWSTDKVFSQTLNTVKSLDYSYEILPPWYDVDTDMDLDRLLQSHDPLIATYQARWNRLLCEP